MRAEAQKNIEAASIVTITLRESVSGLDLLRYAIRLCFVIVIGLGYFTGLQTSANVKGWTFDAGLQAVVAVIYIVLAVVFALLWKCFANIRSVKGNSTKNNVSVLYANYVDINLLSLVVCNIWSRVNNYSIYLDNPILTRVGYNNPCVGWDLLPVSAVAVILWPISQFFHFLFAYFVVKNISGSVWQVWLVRLAIVVDLLLSLPFSLLWLITPEINLPAHTLLFSLVMIGLFITAISIYIGTLGRSSLTLSRHAFAWVYISSVIASIYANFVPMYLHPIVSMVLDYFTFTLFVFVADVMIKPSNLYFDYGEK